MSFLQILFLIVVVLWTLVFSFAKGSREFSYWLSNGFRLWASLIPILASIVVITVLAGNLFISHQIHPSLILTNIFGNLELAVLLGLGVICLSPKYAKNAATTGFLYIVFKIYQTWIGQIPESATALAVLFFTISLLGNYMVLIKTYNPMINSSIFKKSLFIELFYVACSMFAIFKCLYFLTNPGYVLEFITPQLGFHVANAKILTFTLLSCAGAGWLLIAFNLNRPLVLILTAIPSAIILNAMYQWGFGILLMFAMTIIVLSLSSFMQNHKKYFQSYR